MSKLRVIEGGKDGVKDITGILKLEADLVKVERSLSYKGLFVYAFHFANLGANRRAIELLDKIHQDYFLTGVYRDLYEALLSWNVYKMTPQGKEHLRQTSEFFIVFRRAMPLFRQLNFKHKYFFTLMDKNHTQIEEYTSKED